MSENRKLQTASETVDVLPEPSPLPSPNDTSPSDVTSARDQKIIGTLLVAAFIVILNETIMNVAVPKLMTELNISASVAQWLSTGFMLTMAVIIPTTGFLIQKFTTRTLFIAALSLFSLGTLVSGAAPGFPVLLVGRVLQACGTGLMMPLLMTVILTLIPPHRRGAAMGTVVIVIAVAPAIGPTISGFVVNSYSWRFLFFLVLPIALGALAYGYKTLVNVGKPSEPKLDVVSVPISALAFGGIVYGFSAASGGHGDGGAAGGWSNPVVIASLAIGVASLIAFVLRQLKLESPLLNLRAFGYSMYTLSVIIVGTLSMAMFSTFLLLPIYLQQVHHFSSLKTGLLMLPGGVLMGISSPITGRLFDRYGPKVLTVTGATFLLIVLWQFTSVNETTPWVKLVLMHCAMMLSISCVMTPVNTTGLNQLPRYLHSHGTAISSTTQQVAGAVGTALLVTIMSNGVQSFLSKAGINAKQALLPSNAEIVRDATNYGIQSAYGVAALLAIIPFVLVFFLKRTHAPDEGEQERIAMAH
ncbi:DHA2 family efflux MFS transporter permease subunit [bacterium]|nr:MAG: DHA2 family efflux MFS transporter permease subunit [bacterium]